LAAGLIPNPWEQAAIIQVLWIDKDGRKEKRQERGVEGIIREGKRR